MAPIEHVPINDNLFVGQLSHQNVTMMNKNNLYDLNINRTQINSVPDYGDKQLIEKFEHKNHTIHKRRIAENKSSYNSTATFLSQYFAFLSYFVGNNSFISVQISFISMFHIRTIFTRFWDYIYSRKVFKLRIS